MAPFTTLAQFRDLLAAAPGPDLDARTQAEARNTVLTKPPGSLGRLEAVAIHVAGWQGTARPMIRSPQVALFAGNHGVAARGVSAYPPEVTAQMVLNFEAGGAAINAIADSVGARLTVQALELDHPTADFTQGPAMTEEECVAALAMGWDALLPGTDLLVPGEMGIGNTTSAAALAESLFGGETRDWVGRGTGVDDEGLARKAETVTLGLARHGGLFPLAALRALGGREIAAMAGVIAAARAARVPVILDGFICTAAGAVLERAVPGSLDHAMAGHQGAEAAHARLLEALELRPILALDLRLGEGTGGALAIGVVRAACACLAGMATFGEAGVSDG